MALPLTAAGIKQFIKDANAPTGAQWQQWVDSCALLMGGAIHALAQGVALDLSLGTAQALYTVPASLKAVPTHIVLRDADGNASAGVIQFGADGAVSDWLTGVNLTNLTAATQALRIEPGSGATPVIIAAPYVATKVLSAKMSTVVASRNCVADVFGYLLSAP